MMAFFALVGSVVRRQTRSALPLLALGAFVVLAQALPTEPGVGASELRRQMLGAMLNSGALVLLCCAFALPAATMRERRGILCAGGLSTRARCFALWLAHSSVLLLLGCLLGVVAALLLLAVAGISERPGESPTLRTALAVGPEQPVLVTGGHKFVCALPDADSAEHTWELRLRPVVRVIADDAVPASMRVPLALSVRASDGRELAAERVHLAPQGVVSLHFRAALQDAPLQVLVQLQRSGLGLEFDHASVSVQGPPASVLASTLRALLGLALLAAVISAGTCWFTGFVSHPLAVLAMLSALAGLLLSPMSVPDLVATVRGGAAIGWSELGRCALATGGAGVFCTAFAFVDRRAGGVTV
ncbi:MAG: hypothetical protein EXS14_00345 [Planctomycetes bacterium]|nr:hypothetical protein [Planctomycetota bacterium]